MKFGKYIQLMRQLFSPSFFTIISESDCICLDEFPEAIIIKSAIDDFSLRFIEIIFFALF